MIIVSVAALAFVVLFFVERKLFDLAAMMFRIDLFAFGGGFASVPLMFHEIVEVRSWMDGANVLKWNCFGADYSGTDRDNRDVRGLYALRPDWCMVATVSVFLPSFLIVIGVTPYFDRLRNSAYFAGAIRAILCSFVGLLLTVTFRFASNIPWDIPRVLLAAAAFVALLFKVEIIWIVLVGTVISVFFL